MFISARPHSMKNAAFCALVPVSGSVLHCCAMCPGVVSTSPYIKQKNAAATTPPPLRAGGILTALPIPLTPGINYFISFPFKVTC